MLHVLPVKDRHEHLTDTPVACPCHPDTQLVDGGQVIVHNLWDKGRALREDQAAIYGDIDSRAL